MKFKKIIFIILLIVFIGIIGILIYNVNNQASKKINNSTENTNVSEKFSKNISGENNIKENNSIESTKAYEVKELDDGTLYSIEGKEYKSDIIIGDDYFDTTINDIFLNPDNYKDKIIEIEGMYMENTPYTFVGRYSTSSLCPYCSAGYSYLEYQLKGIINRDFKEEEDWIKIKGTLGKGNDETSYYQDYYFLEVLSLEVMNERGQETIKN